MTEHDRARRLEVIAAAAALLRRRRRRTRPVVRTVEVAPPRDRDHQDH
jgi:hypothetical protein